MDRDGMARSGPAALAGLLLLGCSGEGPAAVEPREEEERPLPDPVTLTAVLNENQVVPDLAGEDCAPIAHLFVMGE